MTGRQPLKITGSTWSPAVTAAQKLAWRNGCLLKLTLDQTAELETLWDQVGGEIAAFEALLTTEPDAVTA